MSQSLSTGSYGSHVLGTPRIRVDDGGDLFDKAVPNEQVPGMCLFAAYIIGFCINISIRIESAF